ncbi:hypothetical protein LT330_008602 [Penicillium expansum]|uniref:RNA polymerase I-specific transcription initiation factor RRN6-like protein n=1 Tax=Penicillium expansum TaxID=27334 RepID=A0A0A2JJV5_PENEN|nr:hypothetical protein PEX2_049290 [Penicillium expansum]KAK4866261.1 hypothetical protein LT330_008602 [Penicillium expansum]KGO46447.1 hypothetical protein PEXP_100040 [Penicillium expansum]KGO51890.1 hypothetical protein PEX1_103060 [Penicillium expansum]KGO55639.1 hypothetical protein PEX2_049290 [Penicillium expansum]
MDEHPGSALHYGQVGRAVYLPDEQDWTFTRSFARPPSIQYTGVTKTTIPSPFRPPKARPIPRVPEKNTRKVITNAHPDLAASWSSIRAEPLSKAVTTITEKYDPEISELFDIGYAVDQRRHDTRLRSVPIAVAVTGESRNIISFRTLEEEILELSSPQKLAFRAPSISPIELSEWSNCGAPVRQIHFARPLEEKPMFMAARLPTMTTIFRPLYHWDPVPMHFPEDAILGSSAHLKNSRLDANPIAEIPVSRTGGFSHADVTFNPWYQRQFAVVDTRGKWSVWEITGRQRLQQSNWATELVKSGSLPLRDYKRKHSCPRVDGWASIEWIHNVGLIVVSNRHSVIIYAFTDNQIPPRTVELGMNKQSEWVLDVQRNPRKPSQFFVLTTTRILWFDVGAIRDEDDASLSLYPQVSWRHFRDPEDTTLRLSDIVVYQDLYLVLYSQITRLVQVFPCPFISDEYTECVSIPDPLVFDAPLLDEIPPTKRDSVVRFSRFVFREIAHSVTPMGRNFYNAHLPLIKLFWMDSDLAVHESTFKAPRGDSDEPDLFRQDSVLRLRRRYAPTSYVRPTDDFIVDDWDESATKKTIVRRCKPKIGRIGIRSDLQWTLDFSGVYRIATGKMEIRRKKQNKIPRPRARTIGGLLAILQSEMKNGSKRPPGRTMFELTSKRLLAEGLDESADEVKRLISALVPEHADPDAHCRYMLLPIPSSNGSYGMPAKLSGEADRDLLNTYDQMIDDWMSTLPRTIPVQTRLMKEKLIRGVVADLILSRLIKISTSLDSIILSKPADPVEERAIQEANEKAAAKNKYQSSYFALLSSQTAASQAKSRTFGSRRDTVPVQQSKYAAVPVLGGLSAFITFKTPRPTPRKVANLLSHWPVGTSPQNYIWDRIDDEETRNSQSRTSKNRRKKRSQTRDQSLPSTPAVPMVRAWGSQPLAPPRVNINSSQLDSMPMTQMERGAFGTRTLKKPKKKKKRQAGF